MKKEFGIFYTELFNPFSFNFFKDWVYKNKLKKEAVLEPFAGANSIIDMLQNMNYANKYNSYDLMPKSPLVITRDTIQDFPLGYNFCVTNPPWLYKSRAKRLGITLPNIKSNYDNLYKDCLSLCLNNCNFVAVLIPASFLQAGIFLERLEAVSVITKKMFRETDNPVCLALFSDKITNDFSIYENDNFIGTHNSLKEYLSVQKNDSNAVFNNPTGELGFIAIDNSIEASIKFCNGKELKNYDITSSSRSITRIAGVKVNRSIISDLNKCISDFRDNTKDVFLTPFKGIRKDGKYRRRMDFGIARNILQNV